MKPVHGRRDCPYESDRAAGRCPHRATTSNRARGIDLLARRRQAHRADPVDLTRVVDVAPRERELDLGLHSPDSYDDAPWSLAAFREPPEPR